MNEMMLYPATCAGPILKGTTKPIVAVISAPGTPGYVYKLYVDGVQKSVYPASGTTVETSHTFSYAFNELAGDHTYKTEVTDSCSPAKVVSDQCVINITEVMEAGFNWVAAIAIVSIGAGILYAATRKKKETYKKI